LHFEQKIFFEKVRILSEKERIFILGFQTNLPIHGFWKGKQTCKEDSGGK